MGITRVTHASNLAPKGVTVVLKLKERCSNVCLEKKEEKMILSLVIFGANLTPVHTGQATIPGQVCPHLADSWMAFMYGESSSATCVCISLREEGIFEKGMFVA